MSPNTARGFRRGPSRSRGACGVGLRCGSTTACRAAQYYLPERRDGTLICHFRQRAHGDPFLEPGLQDITAWVDFTLLAEAGAAAGFTLAGFCTQSFLLAALGADQEMRHLAGADENRFARLANEARRLMMPGEMGERFKAMAWLRDLDMPLSGFSLQDLRHTL